MTQERGGPTVGGGAQGVNEERERVWSVASRWIETGEPGRRERAGGGGGRGARSARGTDLERLVAGLLQTVEVYWS